MLRLFVSRAKIVSADNFKGHLGRLDDDCSLKGLVFADSRGIRSSLLMLQSNALATFRSRYVSTLSKRCLNLAS